MADTGIDRGAIFATGFTVRPCEGGSFVLSLSSTDRGMFTKTWAFSHIGDLMAFLNDQAVRPAPNGAASKAAPTAPLGEDAVRNVNEQRWMT